MEGNSLAGVGKAYQAFKIAGVVAAVGTVLAVAAGVGLYEHAKDAGAKEILPNCTTEISKTIVANGHSYKISCLP